MVEGVEIIDLEDRDRWNDAQRHGGLPSHTWTYAWGLSASGIKPRLAIVQAAGSRMTMVFFEREWHGSTDIATIYGLSGAWIAPRSPAPLALWSEFAVSKGWVAGYLQLSPYVDLDRELASELTSHNDVFVLDLQGDPTLASASRTVQRKIKLAQGSGVTLVSDREPLADGLKRLYPQTMQSLGVVIQPTLSHTTLERWALDPSSLLLGAQKDGVVTAVYLFLIAKPFAESHVLAYSESGRDLTAWLIWSAAPQLRAQGVTTLNLGGGARRGDGIAQFKEKFNGARKPLRAIRQVYDRDNYDRLCAAAGVVATSDGWFPAYRAQAVAS